MKEIKFTVLMCTYFKDDPYLLKKAIESVFKNSIKPNFFILTIDGPIPEINNQIINDLKKSYAIEVIYLKENVGLALALNSSLKFVKTDWIARADSDDINLEKRFSTQLKYAQLNYDVIGSNILEIDRNGKLPNLKKNMPITNLEIREYIKSRNPINHMTVFYKKEVIISNGGYPNIYQREDYGLWAKLMHKNCLFYNVEDILVHVNGGKSLYKRRGGYKNAIAEIKLQLLLFKCKIKPLGLLIFDLFLRSAILLLPNKILEKIYTKILRVKQF